MGLLRFFSVIAALAVATTAGVVPRDEFAAMDVNATLLSNLNLYEQYSAATYCTADDIATPGTPILCASETCPLVEQNLATISFSFLNAGIGGVTGFVATDNTEPNIILAFRGVRSIESGINTLDTTLVDTSLCGDTVGCQINQGFRNSWESVSARITEEIANAQTATGFTNLVVTGHGVGGALAVLAATQYRTTPLANIPNGNILLYTYGSPRVGNAIFARFVTNNNDLVNFRVTHTDDPIPKFPSRSRGYLQWGPEYWITAPTGDPVHTNDIQQIADTEKPTGNGGRPPSLDFPAHLWYFNNVEACI